jgi:uncharacterized Zn finger protein (UPF0148 family)
MLQPFVNTKGESAVSNTESEQHKPCVSDHIRTRKFCEFRVRYGARCRNRATRSCCHGIHCEDHDKWLHEIAGRHPGDFVCAVCDAHFHDRNDPALSAHTDMHMAARRMRQDESDKKSKAEVAIETTTMEQKIATMGKDEALAWMRSEEGRSATAAQKIAALRKAGLTDERGRYYHMMDQNKGQ